MTTAQHTPGPWANHDGIIRDCSPEGWLVATCRFSPKDDANARLIAAAPELLAALQEAQLIIDTLADALADCGRAVLAEAGTIAAMDFRAAIAKATEQPSP